MADRRLIEFAPAKINLTLTVAGKRADGFHDLASLVTFASIGDVLSLRPGSALSLAVSGPFAEAAGDSDANLVLKAARALKRRRPELALGQFILEKRLPVAAGLGGGSADAAASLRLIARANGLSPADADLVRAAEETGSDVPVCLAGGSRMMRGRGEILGPLLRLPSCSAVLVNPGVRLETARVFKALRRQSDAVPGFEPPADIAADRDWLAAIAACRNDLEAPAIGLEPAVEAAKQALGAEPGCLLARMTGSGATVFGLFAEAGGASAAASSIARARPRWWVQAATLGAGA
ncbi:4-diphosphocytidyl-2-C-methyl-D-erythritol kinase [Rhizobiales bacterium GAS188]|nr:4-diphosphocytidyl-2-C-methyl-D-erythritol kinase [Rhizobiales bacterium GAS188]